MYNSHLSKIVLHAYNTVPYYNDLFKKNNINPQTIINIDDLKCFPLLYKEIIQKEPQRFISTLYSSEQLLREGTSGSTGKPLTIYKTYNDRFRSLLSLWEVRSKVYKVHPSEKRCSFHLFIRKDNKIDTPMIYSNNNEISFSFLMLNDNNMKEYCNKIIEIRPEWLFGPPSAIFILSEYIYSNNIRMPNSLKYIELAGEYLTDVYRKKIENVFQVAVVNHYGCAETYGIAIECPQRQLHCLSDNVIVEILKDGKKVDYDQQGDICITSLNNKGMPFIRYMLGDKGTLNKNDGCTCGSKNQILKISAGRVTDYILFKNKKPLNSGVFYYAAEFINIKYENPILQFQIIQEDYEYFKMIMALDRNFIKKKDAIWNEFLFSISVFGLANYIWEIDFVDQIQPDESTGKLKYFISKISNSLV